MVVKRIIDKPDTRRLKAGPSNKLHPRAIVNWGQSGCMKDADACLEPQCLQAYQEEPMGDTLSSPEELLTEALAPRTDLSNAEDVSRELRLQHNREVFTLVQLGKPLRLGFQHCNPIINCRELSGPDSTPAATSFCGAVAVSLFSQLFSSHQQYLFQSSPSLLPLAQRTDANAAHLAALAHSNLVAIGCQPAALELFSTSEPCTWTSLGTLHRSR
ncbi:hypothetical protein MMC14_008996 [Varicellaria rhodocarpa]|nr:hypothetical protein [Varicellaria rhodocarpa]